MSYALSLTNYEVLYDEKKICGPINLKLNKGEVLGIFGPNGSGKSTLLKAISGVAQGNSALHINGSIEINGSATIAKNGAKKAKLIGYVPAKFSTEFPVTVIEAIGLGSVSRRYSWLGGFSDSEIKAIDQVISKVGLTDLKQRFLHELSGGELQRVSFARALTQNAEITFFDESFSQMDVNFEIAVGNEIRRMAKLGSTYVLVNHDLNFLTQFCDKILFLKNGEMIANGTVEMVLTEDNLIKLYPDMEYEIFKNSLGNQTLVWHQK